jgi:hypothetical protein
MRLPTDNQRVQYIGSMDRISPCNQLRSSGPGEVEWACNNGDCPGYIDKHCRFKDTSDGDVRISPVYIKLFRVLKPSKVKVREV